APEVLDESAEITPAADVYGAGSVVYELLTGKTPLVIGYEPAGELRTDLGEEASALLMACVAARPERRRGAAEVLQRLRNLVREERERAERAQKLHALERAVLLAIERDDEAEARQTLAALETYARHEEGEPTQDRARSFVAKKERQNRISAVKEALAAAVKGEDEGQARSGLGELSAILGSEAAGDRDLLAATAWLENKERERKEAEAARRAETERARKEAEARERAEEERLRRQREQERRNHIKATMRELAAAVTGEREGEVKARAAELASLLGPEAETNRDLAAARNWLREKERERQEAEARRAEQERARRAREAEARRAEEERRRLEREVEEARRAEEVRERLEREAAATREEEERLERERAAESQRQEEERRRRAWAVETARRTAEEARTRKTKRFLWVLEVALLVAVVGWGAATIQEGMEHRRVQEEQFRQMEARRAEDDRQRVAVEQARQEQERQAAADGQRATTEQARPDQKKRAGAERQGVAAEQARIEREGRPEEQARRDLIRHENGSLEIRVDVVGATVLLDGRLVGHAPQVVEAAPGQHVVEAVGGDCRAEVPVELVGGEKVALQLTLVCPTPTPAAVPTQPPEPTPPPVRPTVQPVAAPRASSTLDGCGTLVSRNGGLVITKNRWGIVGRVVDSGGQALPGVTVMLDLGVHSEPLVALTKADGVYRFASRRRTAECTLKLVLAGFQTLIVPGLRPLQGRIGCLDDAVMGGARSLEEVTITGQALTFRPRS
ncbi:MAG: hypothetical protein LAO05_18535, partial [Acidobacteriia bacterium]|nr:hypothetical protein [Terriglobia bacterium]